jgi:hypothetical protein
VSTCEWPAGLDFFKVTRDVDRGVVLVGLVEPASATDAATRLRARPRKFGLAQGVGKDLVRSHSSRIGVERFGTKRSDVSDRMGKGRTSRFGSTENN